MTRWLLAVVVVLGTAAAVVLMLVLFDSVSIQDARRAAERSDDRCRTGEIMMRDSDGRLACIVGRRPK